MNRTLVVQVLSHTIHCAGICSENRTEGWEEKPESQAFSANNVTFLCVTRSAPTSYLSRNSQISPGVRTIAARRCPTGSVETSTNNTEETGTRTAYLLPVEFCLVTQVHDDAGIWLKTHRYT